MVLYIGNYLLIQAAIVAFIAPFYIWYAKTHEIHWRGLTHFNIVLEHFFTSRQANWLVFAWAFGEALVWFVIPEFLLLLIVFMRVRHKRQLVLWDLYGTAVGVVVAYIAHRSLSSVAALPYIQPKMVVEVQRWYSAEGFMGLVHQPFSGVPFKVFNFVAADAGMFLIFYLCWAIIFRMARYVVLYGIFVGIYPGLHKYVRRNYVPLFCIATLIFSVLLLKVYWRYG